MKTYFITNGIQRTAGTEKVIVQLASELNGVDIIVPGTTEVAFDVNGLNILSANIGDFPNSGFFAKIHHRYKYFLWLKRFFKENQSENSENVVSFTFDLNVLNIVLFFLYRYKSIVCEHIEYNYHNSFFRKYIRKLLYRINGVSLVCLTQTDTDKFREDGVCDVLTIPNFVSPVSSVYNNKSKTLLAVGRLEYQKNFAFLIKSFILSEVYKQGWVLHIFGEGKDKEDLTKIIAHNQMKEFIKINPFKKDLSEEYKNSAGLCMSSRFEAFPMVLLEAMNYSLPVLVTDFPTGAREILGERNAQIVREYTEEKYAESLKDFCFNIELREKFSVENKTTVKNYYPSEIIKSWSKLLGKN